VTFTGIAALLFGVALAGKLFPARRATRGRPNDCAPDGLITGAGVLGAGRFLELLESTEQTAVMDG